MRSLLARICVVAALSIALAEPSLPANKHELRLQGSKLTFATAAETGRLLVSDDPYMRQLSDVDRQLLAHSDAPISRKALDKLLTNSGREFSPSEKARLTAVVAELDYIMEARDFKLPLPNHVILAKNDPMIFDGTAYTRGNAIYLTTRMLDMPEDFLVAVLAHELFHVSTRAHPELRQAVFPSVGFFPCTVALSSVGHDIADIRITNPDTEDFGRYCIKLANSGETKTYTPILIKLGNYHGNNFARIVHPVLLELSSDGMTPAIENGNTKTRELDVPYIVATGGNSLTELWHPEEIAANNFHTAVHRGRLLGNPNLAFAEKIAVQISAVSKKIKKVRVLQSKKVQKHR